MNSSYWFPWPVLFFLFIIIYCPIVGALCAPLNFPQGDRKQPYGIRLPEIDSGRWEGPALPGPFVQGLSDRRTFPPAARPGKPPYQPGYVTASHTPCLLSLGSTWWECSFQVRQWGATAQWNHRAPKLQAFQALVIRQQNICDSTGRVSMAGCWIIY